jgi:hypothetical protein
MEPKNELVPGDVPPTGFGTVGESSDGDVTLTLQKNKFAEFLFGFLGARETLTKTYNDDFVATLEDCLQFHYLFTQKIVKEQFIALSAVGATITYDDNSTRTINSITALERFAEPRDVSVNVFSMTWNLVFRSPEDNSFKQQKVSIVLETAQTPTDIGKITVTVEHTNQVWATEVQRLFEEQIRQLLATGTRVYRILQFGKRLKIFGFIANACVISIAVGVLFVLLARQGLLATLTAHDEFAFDVASVIAKSDHKDISLAEQFMLLRELEQSNSDVVKQLYEKGYFRGGYAAVAKKMISGYYDGNRPSFQLAWTSESRIHELEAIARIKWAWTYLRFVTCYLLLFWLCGLYLKLFRLRSILVLTSKGRKLAAKQERDKSTLVQFAYGVIASLLAGVIFEFGVKLLLRH